MVAGPTSGGHVNPGYTLSFAIFKGFPWRKVPCTSACIRFNVPKVHVTCIRGSLIFLTRDATCHPVYIFSQVLGAFLGASMSYVQYKDAIDAITIKMLAGPNGQETVFGTSGVSNK